MAEIKPSIGLSNKSSVNDFPFTDPVKNVRVLIPDKFDKCDSGISFEDKSFAGMFPDNNAIEFFNITGAIKKPCE